MPAGELHRVGRARDAAPVADRGRQRYEEQADGPRLIERRARYVGICRDPVQGEDVADDKASHPCHEQEGRPVRLVAVRGEPGREENDEHEVGERIGHIDGNLERTPGHV